MREHVNLPNVVTTGNLVSGFLALLVAPHSLPTAAGLVVLAALIDTVDGFLARRRGRDQRFGAELDSLADLLSFGAVPAYAVWTAFDDSPVWLVLPVALSFVVAGAWRLARFPLVKQSTGFVGLPITASGILVMVLACTPFALPSLVVVLVLAALMVSTVPFPSLVTAAAEVSALRHPRSWRRPRPRLRRRRNRQASRPGRPHRPPRVGAWARARLSRLRRIARAASRRGRDRRPSG